MALLQSELFRIRDELGYPALTVGAMPYVDIVSMFEQVILPFTEAGAITTSTTTVAAATAPTLVTITLQDATGVHAQDRIVLDVDGHQEIVSVVAAPVGNAVSAYLSLAHNGTIGYPVTVEGGEAIVRQHLRRLYSVASRLEAAVDTAGIKQVDNGDVIFFESKDGGNSEFKDLSAQREYWRDELASAIGVINLRKYRRGGATSTLEVY